MNPDRQYFLSLNWTYPVFLNHVNLEEEDKHLAFNQRGIYLITRQFTTNAKEETIYIGKTARSFRRRLWEHLNKDHSNWTNAHGIIRIRLALISQPTNMSYAEFDDCFLEDVESALIYEQMPAYNTDKKQSYHWKYDLHIVNKNIRQALLTHDIRNRNHTI